jgi:tetratricopeptide (TPR) repeat protein
MNRPVLPFPGKHKKCFKIDWLIGALGALVVMTAPGLAQTVVEPAAGSAENLENSGASARAYGMGTAFVGVADDASALFFNPAGLSALSLPQLALNHNSYLAGTFQETLVYGFPSGSLGGMAAAVNYINWGALDLRDIYGNSQGSYNDTDVGLVFGWGKEWLKGFSAGLALQAVQQKVVDSLYNSLSARLGVLWQLDTRFRLGASYSNLGTNVEGSPLSQSLQAGGSYRFDWEKNKALLLAFAGGWEPEGISSLQCGLEGELDHTFLLRGGYEIPLDGQIAGGSTAFFLGAGLKLGNFNLDYAYVPFGDFGVSNRISLGYEFSPAPKEVVQVPVTVIQRVMIPAPTPLATPSIPNSTKTSVQVKFKVPMEAGQAGQGSLSPSQQEIQIQSYLQSIKTNPQNVQNWWQLGNLYYQTDQKDSAIQCFEQVLRLKPDNQALSDWLAKYKAAQP